MKRARANRAENVRPERVGDAIRQVLGTALLHEVSDHRLGSVSITDVRVAPDVRHARVFWQLLATEQVPADVAAATRALQAAAGFLRGIVAREMNLRFTPEIVFEHDVSIERGRHMETVLASLRGDSLAPPADAPAPDMSDGDPAHAGVPDDER